MSTMETLSPRPRRSYLRRGLLAAGLVAGGMVIGAGSLAVAAGGDGLGNGMGWHHHHRGPHVGMIQRLARGALDNVGATTAQEDKVHDIIASAMTELGKDGTDRGAMRKQMLDLMKAPTLDRGAFEKLRAQRVADMDAKSKVISNAFFDAASQLSADQRAKLADNVEHRMEHRGWGGRRDRMDGPDRQPGPDDRGPGGQNHG